MTRSSRAGRAARRSVSLACAATVLVALSGCARFDDSASTPFSPEPTFGAADVSPGDPSAPESSAPPPPPPGPCVDPDPAVIATCLDTLGGLVTLPGGGAALVAERVTGAVVEVAPGTAPRPVTSIPVDPSPGGGLIDLALSPTYAEDRLLYAYVVTPTDARVVRIAPGDVPKPVLTGIPRGTGDVGGAVDFVGPSELRVATGSGGDSAAAADPASLAGKVLSIVDPRVDGSAVPRVVMSGLGRAGDLCSDGTGSQWVTDGAPDGDRLSRITPEGGVVGPVWTWPDRPGVGGCAAAPGTVAVAMSGARAVGVVPVDPETGSVPTPPALVAQDRYGRLRGATLGADGQILVSTTNKDGGVPTPTDDRVVIVQIPAGGGGND